jgi:peptidoglycan hydrolase-like protein with peptidoglycan-binding domain
MKRLLVLVVATLCVSLCADGYAERHRRGGTTVKEGTKKSKKRRARTPTRTSTPLASQHDEVVLSPALLRQLQRNLIDGGYLEGTADGRLTQRTRRALAVFQREYHMVGTGALDRATAEALLGHDVVGAYTIAAAAQ